MPIIARSIVDRSTRHSGQERGYLKYTLGDSRVFSIGPVQGDLDTLLIEREPHLFSSIQNNDAFNAVSLGVTTAHKEATQEQVYFAWLKTGFDKTEPADAYQIMKNVAPTILALGMTTEQMAAAFGATVEEAQNVLDKWAYLDANSVAIQAYQAVRDSA